MNTRAELQHSDRYGYCYLDREAFDTVMERLGLKKERANFRIRSAEVRYRGMIRGIEVTMTVYNTTRHPYYVQQGKTVLALQQSKDPTDDEGALYVRLHSWMPENTTLRGKGRDKQAWNIYNDLVDALDDVPHTIPCDLNSASEHMTYEEAIQLVNKNKEN